MTFEVMYGLKARPESVGDRLAQRQPNQKGSDKPWPLGCRHDVYVLQLDSSLLEGSLADGRPIPEVLSGGDLGYDAAVGAVGGQLTRHQRGQHLPLARHDRTSRVVTRGLDTKGQNLSSAHDLYFRLDSMNLRLLKCSPRRRHQAGDRQKADTIRPSPEQYQGIQRHFMRTRFAINGVGRIGRALVRILRDRPGLELVAINDLAPIDQIAALISRDTLHGKFPGTVSIDGSSLVLGGQAVATSSEPNLNLIPWLTEEPLVVIDATGQCKSGDLARLHKRGSIQKVVVSANAAKMDLTLCMGVNHQKYDHDRHHLLSAASCTTNCLAPMVHVLDREFGVEHGLFNTVHSYNNDQHLLSFPHPDRRRARAAALNMIPTTTSASHAIHRIIPGLEGKLDGLAIRVPAPDVSLVDLVAELKTTATAAEINTAFVEASEGDLKGIVAVTHEELVSSDFLGDPHSAIIDLPLTQALDNGLVRVVAWYDNEWGHASRLADILEFVGLALS